MLFQLNQIQKHQALVQHIQQSKINLNNKLISSYSSNTKNIASLKQKFQAILKQSALLIHTLRQIEQSVIHKKLLPSVFYEKDITKLLYSTIELPQWFQHVFSKEYQKQKINLQTISSKIYKLHGLAQKNAQLVKQHWNMEILLKRYESLNEKQLQSVDIINQVQSFQAFSKSCKQIYRNFLQMITKKVVQFLQNTVQSTLIYTNQLKKVKSQGQKSFNPNQDYNVLNLNIYSPITKNNISNLDSHNTVKMNKMIDTSIKNKMSDYYIEPSFQIRQKKINNNSTVESLKAKQKANNEYFYRKAQKKQKINDNSLTKQILSPRSYNSNNRYGINSYVSSYNLKNRQESKDSSVKSVKSFYDQSVRLRQYKSMANIVSSPNTYTKKYQNKDQVSKPKLQNIEKISNKKSVKSNNCYHHCPHHDKPLNNHCSKHCNKACSHEKQYFNDFGINLVQMNKKYYQNKEKYHKQILKTQRSINSNQRSIISNQRSYNKYQSRQKDKFNVYTSRQRNIVQDKNYLRNSHDKHINGQFKNSQAKQNMKIILNRPLNKNQNIHIQNFNSPSKTRKNPYYQYQNHKSNINSPSIRVCEYYFN